MSKPLELVIYPRNSDGDYVIPLPNGRATIQSAEDVDVASWTIRFTDAELAAEYHSAESEHAIALYDSLYEKYVEEGNSCTTSRERVEMALLTRSFRRFASLPHYDEVSA